jgi:uncharacterized protein (TIGR03435 family)
MLKKVAGVLLFGQCLAIAAEVPLSSDLQEYEIRPVNEVRLQIRYRHDPKKSGTPYFAVDTVARFLSWSLGVNVSRIVGPDWIYGTRYAVYFRTRSVTNRLSPILLKLLTDQFHLVYRRGTLPAEVLVLTTPHGEPKLKPSKAEKCSGGPSGIPSTDPADYGFREQFPDFKPPSMDLPYPQGTVLFYRGCPVSSVIPALERHLGRLIVDETTSNGRYDFEIAFPPGAPSVRHALGPVAEQLEKKLDAGLKLAVRPIDNALVVDSATPLTAPVSFRQIPAQ